MCSLQYAHMLLGLYFAAYRRRNSYNPGCKNKEMHWVHVQRIHVLYSVLEALGVQPSPPGCFTKKLSEARGNGIGFLAAGEAAAPLGP